VTDSASREEEGQDDLEPIVAHGARMSWAGLLRPGDEFPLPRRSRLGVLTAAAVGAAPKRYFGAWSGVYRRFTSNLTSPGIMVTVMPPSGRRPTVEGERGIECVVHWVDRRDALRTDAKGVCHGDGWPLALWEAFVSRIDDLPQGSVAKRLRIFAAASSTSREEEEREDPVVREWRALLRGASPPLPPARSRLGPGWVPVPATLLTGSGARTGVGSYCILSWSPQRPAGAPIFRSLSEALSSSEALRRKPDLQSQARYYLECDLAKLHGVRFGPDDLLEDEVFARTPEVLSLRERLTAAERERIADPRFGLLDRFGRDE
jgi:hypothetical protein